MIQVPKEEIEAILNDVIKLFLIPKYESLGMKATGNWAEKLQVDYNVIKGEKYTEQLVYGRSGGSLPPISAIEKWVNAKFGYSGQEARQTAWAIAKKIETVGTSWYKKGGSDILEVLETSEVLNYINERLKKYIEAEVTVQLQRELKILQI